MFSRSFIYILLVEVESGLTYCVALCVICVGYPISEFAYRGWLDYWPATGA